MLFEEVEYWCENSRQSLEVEGIAFTWENFMTECLEKYFPADVRNKKEIEFLQLKQVNMIVVDYATKLKSWYGFFLTIMVWKLKVLSE